MPLTRVQTGLLEATGTPSASTFLRGDGAWSTTITSGTAVSASGTAVDFTGISSTAKRITVMFSGVSLSGTDNFLIQIGPSGGVETSSYSSSSIYAGSATGSGVSTAGFLLINGAASNVISGIITLVNLTGNTWVYNGMGSSNGDTVIVYGTGVKTVASTLAIVRVTRSGTDTFDAGTINILVE
jgi:hypothetical protein